MPNVSHRQYELGHGSMYTVDVWCSCPTCGELVGVRVEGADATVTEPCPYDCHLKSSYDHDTLQQDAYAMAEQERRYYAQHEAEYDPR